MMKAKVTVVECVPVPAICFPFFWLGDSGTIWWRTHSTAAANHPDVAINGGHYRLGAHHFSEVPDQLAWSKRLPPGSTVLLIQE